jgi:hypothetical protein
MEPGNLVSSVASICQQYKSLCPQNYPYQKYVESFILIAYLANKLSFPDLKISYEWTWGPRPLIKNRPITEIESPHFRLIEKNPGRNVVKPIKVDITMLNDSFKRLIGSVGENLQSLNRSCRRAVREYFLKLTKLFPPLKLGQLGERISYLNALTLAPTTIFEDVYENWMNTQSKKVFEEAQQHLTKKLKLSEYNYTRSIVKFEFEQELRRISRVILSATLKTFSFIAARKNYEYKSMVTKAFGIEINAEFDFNVMEYELLFLIFTRNKISLQRAILYSPNVPLRYKELDTLLRKKLNESGHDV